MLTYNRHIIQRDIDYYFRQHAMTDMIVFGNNFIQMCPYTIWKSVLGHAEFDRNSIAPDNSIEELLEKIKENQKKPQNQSSWMARMQEMQRQQKEMMEAQKKKNQQNQK